jgi:MFS family permease
VAFDNPARRSFVSELVPERNLTNAVSLNSALMTGARVVGPAMAGLLVNTVGFGWCFAADALSYIAVLIALGRIRPAELRLPPVTPRKKGQVREGFRYARNVPELFVPLMMTAIIGTLAYNFPVVFPVFATRSLGGTETTFTLLYSVVAIGSLIGALATARRKSVTVRVVAIAAIAFGVMMTLLALAPDKAVAFPIGLIMGIASMSFMTSSTAIVQLESAPDMRGRVLALQAMVFLGSTPIGGPIVGWVVQQFGARYGLALGALSALAAGAWGLRVVGRQAAAQGAEVDATTRLVAELTPDDPEAMMAGPDLAELAEIEVAGEEPDYTRARRRRPLLPKL